MKPSPVVLSIIVCLLATPRLHAEAGFHRLTDPNLPACFSTLENKIFRIMTYTQEPNIQVPSIDYEKYIALKQESAAHHKIAEMIEACQAQQLPTCALNFNSTCTAFFWRDWDRLTTNNHCFQSATYNNDLEFELSDRNDFLRHYNSKQMTCDWGLIGSDRMQSQWYPNTPATKERTDFVDIILDMPESDQHLLVKAQQPPQMDESLYIVGFPMPTAARKLADKNAYDADDWDVLVTIGKRFSTAKMLDQVMNLSPSLRHATRSNIGELTYEGWSDDLYFDADFNQGMSGAPVLNAQCELVGLVRASLCADIDLSTQYCAKGVFASSIKWLESL